MLNRLPLDTPEHLTTFQAAELLGMAVRSIQLMVNRQELDAWKTPGGHRRITRTSLLRWLQEHPTHQKGIAANTSAVKTSSPGKQFGQRTHPVVLLIEDSIHYQNLIRLLKEEFFSDANLQVASDGISGLAMYGELKPEILIVDMLLPGIDGATLISALRTHPAFSQTHLVVVTSLTAEQLIKYSFVLQDVTVIHKTDLVDRLPSAVRAGLDARLPAWGRQ